jgi:hypothetical protein
MLRGILLTGLGYCETNALTVMVNTSTNIKEKKSINSECQQNEQSPLTSTHLMQKKKKTTCDVRNPGPGHEQPKIKISSAISSIPGFLRDEKGDIMN